MPRRFTAPIPIWNSFGQPREVYEEDVIRFLEDAAMQSPPEQRALIFPSAWRWEGFPRLPHDVYFTLRRHLIAGNLSSRIRGIARFTERVAIEAKNALEVDDNFLLFVNPDIAAEMYWAQEAYREVDVTPDKREQSTVGEILSAALIDWMKGRVRRLYPELSLASVRDFVMSGSLPCWHPRSHERIRQRVGRGGRGHSVRRRSAVWGTYVVAWLVGTETAAVRLWNLVVGPEYRWGDPGDPAYALAKYSDAKRRMISHLQSLTGQKVIPLRPLLQPEPPLEADVLADLETMLLGFLGRLDSSTEAELVESVWGYNPFQQRERSMGDEEEG